MPSPFSYGGMHDDWLTSEVAAMRQRRERVSQNRLILALSRAKGMRNLDADRVVDDYCRRGVLQDLLGDGLYDGWLTRQIEAA